MGAETWGSVGKRETDLLCRKVAEKTEQVNIKHYKTPKSLKSQNNTDKNGQDVGQERH